MIWPNEISDVGSAETGTHADLVGQNGINALGVNNIYVATSINTRLSEPTDVPNAEVRLVIDSGVNGFLLVGVRPTEPSLTVN